MPQDPNLYGQRPPKRQKKEIDLSSSLAFTSQVAALLSAPSASSPSSSTTMATTSGRARPSRSKPDIFSGAKAKRKTNAPSTAPNRLALRDPIGTEDDRASSARARLKMEEKARLYAAMKRGDYVAKEGEAAPLVDFDRKWAEKQLRDGDDDDGGEASSSGSDTDDDDNIDREVIEYEDEFGRLRRGTAADKQRLERQLARGTAAATELEGMSARPRAPQGLIYGDAVQTAAFAAADDARMEELAARRDRSATPPEAEHYRADREIRSKGVGFYAFSADEERRTAEMAALGEERARTEALRKERADKVAARRREVEERRREIGERRARKMADSFLDGLGKDIVGGGGTSGDASDNGATKEEGEPSGPS